MENSKIKPRNNSIDIFRLVCAVLVVSIHTSPLLEVDYRLYYLFTQIVPRVAVPFFFAVSGYYYIKALLNGKKIFFSYLRRLLIIYSVWSAIYFIWDVALDISRGSFVYSKTIITIIKKFFIFGSSYQL